ncbi:hypothetical protein WMF30_02900 [Sorangium sp. So ce134]
MPARRQRRRVQRCAAPVLPQNGHDASLSPEPRRGTAMNRRAAVAGAHRKYYCPRLATLPTFLVLPPATGRNAMGTIYCDRSSENARASFIQNGHVVTDGSDRADLLWIRKGYQPYFRALREDQLINHIPSERHMINKGLMTLALKRFEQRQASGDLRLRDFYQDTYLLFDRADRARFFAQLPGEDRTDNLWILKPGNESRGRGVRILWKLQGLRQACEAGLLDRAFEENQYIIQRYIKNPLLLEGRKSEIRVYWLIASLDPLVVLVYKEGTVRLNTLPFELDDFDNPLIHVTNVYQQKRHPGHDPSAVLKWTFDDLRRYLADRLNVAGPSYLEDSLRPAVKRCLSYVVRACHGALLERRPARGHCFGLYGADLIIDDTLYPWLTEVQKGPGLSFDDPVKRTLIPGMLDEAARIMLEIQSRKARRESLVGLESVKGFEYVIDEAQA